jgi:type II secretory pathway pseudopilin PulG
LASLGSQGGLGIIEIVIAVGIFGIVISGMISLFDSQNRQTAAIAQKLETVDLKSQIQASQTNSNNCTCLLNQALNTTQPALPLEFNSTLPNQSMELQTFFGGCDGANRPVLPLAVKGQPLPGSHTGVRVRQILLKDIQNVSGTEFSANFEIQFEPAGMVIARPSIVLAQRFNADLTDPTQATVASCIGPGGGGGGGGGGGTTGWVCNLYHIWGHNICVNLTTSRRCVGRGVNWVCNTVPALPSGSYTCAGSDKEIACVDTVNGSYCELTDILNWSCTSHTGWSP